MNRQLIFILAGIALVGSSAAFFVLNRPEAPPPEAAVAAPPRSAPPPVAVAPRVEATPAPAPAPEPRRPAAPAPEPAAPAPVAAAPTVATLFISSDVDGAQVFVDRQFVGQAPATAPDLKAGPHVINVSAKGYESVAMNIDVAPGPREVLVKLREVRLDAKLQVVHKHRMGSCTGQLLATPSGMRYETTDKDDAFSSALLELETFQVDYLKKNLRIKAGKGKQYDFTDPEGNADRLFVFHRDVDKARERLKRGDPAAER